MSGGYTPPTRADDDEPRFENCSVEVARWGDAVWLTIRSEQSVGKSIELSRPEALALAEHLKRSASSTQRRIRDEPQA